MLFKTYLKFSNTRIKYLFLNLDELKWNKIIQFLSHISYFSSHAQALEGGMGAKGRGSWIKEKSPVARRGGGSFTQHFCVSKHTFLLFRSSPQGPKAGGSDGGRLS